MNSPERVAAAFQTVARINFLPAIQRDATELDIPLSIGHGQTNSQPTTVRLMLEWLDVQPGDKVLDVGSGSGWTTALLAHLTGTGGQVYGVEIVPELRTFGEANCQKQKLRNVSFHQAGEITGLPKFLPYERILVSAAAPALPPELIEQLSTPGRLVIPVNHDVLVITKKSNHELEAETHQGFSFVPLLVSG